MLLYTTLKTGSYFQLKCSTPLSLMLNVVYKSTCSCDTNVTYIGMTTRHLGVRVKEYLNSKKNLAVQKRINVCQSCKENTHLFDNFSILKAQNQVALLKKNKKNITKT